MEENEMHLSPKEALILDLLLSTGNRERYGLEMVAGSNNELKKGTIYVTLGRMEKAGLVTSREEAAPAGEQGPRRRLYQATGRGEQARIARRAWHAALKTSEV